MYFRILLNKNNAFFYNHIWIGVNIENCLNLKFKSFIEDHILHSELHINFHFLRFVTVHLVEIIGVINCVCKLTFHTEGDNCRRFEHFNWMPSFSFWKQRLTTPEGFTAKLSKETVLTKPEGFTAKLSKETGPRFFFFFFFYKITQDYFDQTGELKTCSYLETSWIVHLPSPW